MGHTFTEDELNKLSDLSMKIKALTVFVSQALIYESTSKDEISTLAQMAAQTAVEIDTMLDV